MSKLHRENLSSLPLYEKRTAKTTQQFHFHRHLKTIAVTHCSSQYNIKGTNFIFESLQWCGYLFSQVEWVSTDRLLRVRCNQPFCEKKTNKSTTEQWSPRDTINVGDIWVFILLEDKFNIGRVLWFAYHKESLKKSKTINLTTSNIADICILCSWYTQESNSDRTFILNTEKDEVVVHPSHPTCERRHMSLWRRK